MYLCDTMKMKPTSEKVLSKIIHRGRGSVFFGSEFLDMGQPEAVHQALSRLAKSGTIERIDSSLYYYPAINDNTMTLSATIIQTCYIYRSNRHHRCRATYPC